MNCLPSVLLFCILALTFPCYMRSSQNFKRRDLFLMSWANLLLFLVVLNTQTKPLLPILHMNKFMRHNIFYAKTKFLVELALRNLEWCKSWHHWNCWEFLFLHHWCRPLGYLRLLWCWSTQSSWTLPNLYWSPPPYFWLSRKSCFWHFGGSCYWILLFPKGTWSRESLLSQISVPDGLGRFNLSDLCCNVLSLGFVPVYSVISDILRKLGSEKILLRTRAEVLEVKEATASLSRVYWTFLMHHYVRQRVKIKPYKCKDLLLH